MGKALKLLKILRDDYIHGELDKDINEAINELEEAMNHKTCKLCAYCEPFNSVCFNDKSPLCADFVNSEYGCIYWKRKDNA